MGTHANGTVPVENPIADAMTFPPLEGPLRGGRGDARPRHRSPRKSRSRRHDLSRAKGMGMHAPDTDPPRNSLPANSGTTRLRLAGLPSPGENFAADHLEHRIEVLVLAQEEHAARRNRLIFAPMAPATPFALRRTLIVPETPRRGPDCAREGQRGPEGQRWTSRRAGRGQPGHVNANGCCSGSGRCDKLNFTDYDTCLSEAGSGTIARRRDRALGRSAGRLLPEGRAGRDDRPERRVPRRGRWWRLVTRRSCGAVRTRSCGWSFRGCTSFFSRRRRTLNWSYVPAVGAFRGAVGECPDPDRGRQRHSLDEPGRSRVARPSSSGLETRSARLLAAARWVLTQFPTPAYAADAKMPLPEYEEFVTRALFLDRPDPRPPGKSWAAGRRAWSNSCRASARSGSKPTEPT